MAPAIVTITTDFGSGSPYVAAMKGRLLEACPDAVLVDVGHSVEPFDVIGGAFVLWAGTRHFPPGAVHLVVIDPGVGTARRAVAFELGGSCYVGPDNGVFGLVLAEVPGTPRGVELQRPPDASATFEGRDVFAPAAGALAAGRKLSALGRPLDAPLRALPVEGPQVLWVDRFGNLITNLKPPARPLVVGGREVKTVVRTFGEAPEGEPFVYVGSMGFLEVGVRQARADDFLEAHRGTRISA